MSDARVSITNDEESSILHGHVDITKRLFSFSDSMVLKCAVELRIADIIHSKGQPLTLSQIASSIDSPTVNISYLFRIMRMLVRMNIFTVHKTNGGDNSILRYGLSPSSNVILHDDEKSLAPFLLLQSHPTMLSTWHHLSDCVREGGSGFKKTHGCELFEMASFTPELNKMFNDGMRCLAKLHAKAIFSTVAAARDVFSGIVGTLVDVGGGGGHMIAKIVNEFNDIKGINFDLAHVIEMAPKYDGVTHVAGDMFREIPTCDAIFLKSILHDWGDEDCVKILKNCINVIKKGNGKVIIADIVIKEDEEDEGLYGNMDVVEDILMMAHCVGGKERTRLEWKEILEEAGFPRYNIIKLPSWLSLIEAFIS